jgi:hypothetical protein
MMARLRNIGPLLRIEGKGQFESLRRHGHCLLHRVTLCDSFRNVRKRNHKTADRLVRSFLNASRATAKSGERKPIAHKLADVWIHVNELVSIKTRSKTRSNSGYARFGFPATIRKPALTSRVRGAHLLSPAAALYLRTKIRLFADPRASCTTYMYL